jgi:hypothetical protein
VKVRAADTAVCDLDVDVVLLPLLGLKGIPLHLSIDGARITAKPALEFVIGRHFDELFLLLLKGEKQTVLRLY